MHVPRLTRHFLIIVAIVGTICPIRIFALSLQSADGKDRLRVEPYINYRQAALQLRRASSLFNPERDRDYIDQIYMTLRIVRDVPDLALAVVEPAVFTLRENPGKLEFRIDQAFVDSALLGDLHLVAGKRVEARGVGSFYSPSDLLNEDQDFIDPLVLREGKHFSRIEWRGMGYKLGLGYIPAVSQAWKKGRLWALAEWSLFEVDLGFQMTHNTQRNTTLGFSAARFLGDSVELHFDGRFQSRLSPSTSQADRAFSSIPDNSPGHQLIVGSRIVMTSSLSVVGEYIKNATGLTTIELKNYFAAQAEKKLNNQVPDDPFSRLVGREYAALAVYEDKFLSKFRVSLSGIHSLRDQSSFISASAKYKPSSVVTVGYIPLFFEGGRDSEFGENPIRSVHYLSVESIF
jgi:hypothetical protein